MYDRETVNDYKKFQPLEQLKQMHTILPNDENVNQALRELRYYTVDEIINELERSLNDFGDPTTPTKILVKKTVANRLRNIERNKLTTAEQKAIDSIPKRIKDYFPQDTRKQANGRQKEYSYFYLFILEHLYKEQFNKTIQESAEELLHRSVMSMDELDHLFNLKLGDEYSNIDPYKLNDLKKAIFNKQDKLKKEFLELMSSFAKYTPLNTHLYNVEHKDEFIKVLRYILQADLHEADIVRMTDLLVSDGNPGETLDYVKLIESRFRKYHHKSDE